MAERVISFEEKEKVKQKQKEHWVTKVTSAGNWISVVTMGAALYLAAPVALAYDILGNVGGDQFKEWNNRRIAKKERGRERIAQDSRMAKVEDAQPIPLKTPSSPARLAA